MINYEEALKIIKNTSLRFNLENEVVGLFESRGRVLAEDIFSCENIPSADNSAMDGFAVKSSETSLASKENPVHLCVRSILAAGDLHSHQNEEKSFPKKSCVEIMTGALLPEDAFDSVVKVEDVVRCNGESDQNSDHEIILTAPVEKGANVRPKGTDFKIGQKVIDKDVILQEQHLMAFAALGIDRLKVKRKIRVAVLSTGNEIVPFEQQKLKGPQVRNSSAPFLKLFLERNNCHVELLGILSDDPKRFFQVMKEILERKFDLILTTGAVSMGKWDFITQVLPDLKIKTHFHKVAIRPGKPILLAESEEQNTVLFGLPGNPISTAVGAQFFVKPLIDKILKIETSEKWAQLVADVNKPEGLECFFKAKLTFDQKPNRKPIVEVLKGQASYMIHSFVTSNSWVQLPAQDSFLKAGTDVKVFDL